MATTTVSVTKGIPGEDYAKLEKIKASFEGAGKSVEIRKAENFVTLEGSKFYERGAWVGPDTDDIYTYHGGPDVNRRTFTSMIVTKGTLNIDSLDRTLGESYEWLKLQYGIPKQIELIDNMNITAVQAPRLVLTVYRKELGKQQDTTTVNDRASLEKFAIGGHFGHFSSERSIFGTILEDMEKNILSNSYAAITITPMKATGDKIGFSQEETALLDPIYKTIIRKLESELSNGSMLRKEN